MERTSIYRYVIYLILLIILLIIDTKIQKKKAKDSYIVSSCILLVLMCINTGIIVTLLTIIAVVVIVILNYIGSLLKNKINKAKKINIDILNNTKYVYLLCLANTTINVLKLILF